MIHKDIHAITGIAKTQATWQEYFDYIDTQGKLTMSTVLKILALLIDREEKRENDGRSL